ncbi:MAG: restriction endonuclease subunit S [Bacteroidetes bacterium]|nr:restriction endonuclease subunit S [Bacteroidota bacterium]
MNKNKEHRKLVPELRFSEFERDGEWAKKGIQKLIDDNWIISHLDGNHGALYPKSNEFSDEGIPYISANDFVDGTVDFDRCKRLPLKRAKQFKKGIAKDGDILFAHNATVGPVAMLNTPLDFVILSTTATYFRCDNKKLLNNFLKHSLSSSYFIGQYTRVMSQSTRNQVPITTQRKFHLYVPKNKKEQQKIANTLTSLDTLIAAEKEKGDALQAHKKGLLQQLFPAKGERVPKLRFGEFRGEWEEKELGEIGSPLMCKRIFKEQTTTDPANSIPFYKIGTFGKEADAYIPIELYKEFKEKYSFPKVGDILISASGTIGRLVVYDGVDAYFQDSNIVWIGNDEELVTNAFIYYCYLTLNWQTSDGGVIKRLYNSNLKSMKIFFPKDKEEQQKIANTLSTLDERIAAQSEKIAALEEHKKGLMQQLFPNIK